MRRTGLLAGLLGFLLLFLAAASEGAGPAYPARQIEIASPTAPGGASDLIARIVGDYLSKKWGQPITSVPKPGGGGAIAAQYVLRSKPDGYTMLLDNMTSSSLMVAGMKNPPLTMEDRAFIAMVATCPVGYAVKADAPWKSLDEFAKWAKANPEKLSWATSGATGLPSYGVYQLFGVLSIDPAKTGMVITGGGSESVVQLAGGHVVLACQSVQEEFSLASGGKIRILAITGDQRLSWLPGVPTCKEAGFPQLDRIWWGGITGPKKLPGGIIKAWEDGLAAADKDPKYRSALENLHYVPHYLGSKEFAKFAYDEVALCTPIAEKTGMRK